MIFFLTFTVLVILQRVIELFIAKRNEKNLVSRGAIEYDKTGYKFIVAMHVLFFLSLAAEYLLLQRELNKFWIYFLILFILAQFIRYWAIISLGAFWNTKVIVLPGSKLVIKGPYKFFYHPNYLAVVIELAVIPLMFSCYITFLIFALFNLILLNRRIGIENEALKTLSR